MDKKVIVIGIDCLEPSLAFDKFSSSMPNLTRLRNTGVWAKMKTVIPPITVPAWSCMFSGYDPGNLGIYGFRNRKTNSYDLEFATSRSIKVPRVWDIASKSNKKSIVMYVPQTYPTYSINGYMVSDFLTPGPESQYTYPVELKAELGEKFGPYIVDVPDFRTEDKARLLKDIYKMSEQHFDMFKYMIKNHDWDLSVMVEMGIDRFHHGFWKYIDENHPKFVKGNPFVDSGRQYYGYCDQKLGEILKEIDLDKTNVFVVSDHGAKAMYGGICINDWLIQEGYLKLKTKPSGITRFKDVDIDWNNTVAWGEGGYYGRLFINVKGRDPQGIVTQEQYPKLRKEIKDKLEAMNDQNGKILNTKAYYPEEIYEKVNGFAPDLTVIFGDLYWRSVGSVGNNSIYTFENDTGPDDANHNWYGSFVLAGSGIKAKGDIGVVEIRTIGPTILKLLDLPIPETVKEGYISI